MSGSMKILEKTLSEVAVEWLEQKELELSEASIDRYQMILDCYVLPYMGNMAVKDITDYEIEKLLTDLSTENSERKEIISGSTVLSVRSEIQSILNYARKQSRPAVELTEGERTLTEPLATWEIRKICNLTSFNHTPEMLGVLLSLYCGIRTGELSALHCDDINTVSREIYIHNTMIRVRNRDEDSARKTVLKVTEISRRAQIRTVIFPEELDSYIKEFHVPGRMLLGTEDNGLMDMRTLQNRVEKVFELYKVKDVNLRRLVATYQAGKADRKILQEVFASKEKKRPYDSEFDPQWLMDELSGDLASLRMLLGLTKEELSEVTGISTAAYKGLEEGRIRMNWNQFIVLLFFYRFNEKTEGVVEQLGLYPSSLRERMFWESVE